MTGSPVQVVVASFAQEQGAEHALRELEDAEKVKQLSITDAAVLWKDRSGELHVKEPGQTTGTRGAVYGGVTGAVLGVIAGPVGLAALGGAAIGGLVAKLRDSGFDDERLAQWGADIAPGSSAFVAVIEDKWVTEIEAMLAETAKEVTSFAIADDVAGRFDGQT
jgi:uncharacterized membrane protein